MNEFLLPGMFEPIGGTDEAVLHQAGFDHPGIAHGAPDVFGNDHMLSADDAQEWKGEHLPQFGPRFVQYAAARFNRVDALMEKLLARWSYEPTTVVIFANMNADASGNVNRNVTGNAILYEPPPGFTLALHRLAINVAGFTFGVPFTAAGAYWEVRVNDEMIDGGSLVSGTGSFPVVQKTGTRDALRVRDGEVLSLFVNGTAAFAGKNITVRGQGTLERHPEA